MAGSLNLTREQLALITGGDPRAIKAFEDFFVTLNNLGSHVSTHEPGGSDPLTVDAIPGVGSLRTLGTGAQKAASGIHAATHVTGGGDTIADAVAGGNSGLMSGADKTKVNALVAPYVDTAANLAAANPVLSVGQLGWESDTLSGKIGDGATAYNTLTYFYRGLPVAGEPSLGTPHPTSDAYRSSALVVNTSTNTGGTWSAAVTMNDCGAGQDHAGAKAAWCMVELISGAASQHLAVEAATGFTLSDITVGTNRFKYANVWSDPSGRGWGYLRIHLDSNGQFKWCTSRTNDTVNIGSAIDYEE